MGSHKLIQHQLPVDLIAQVAEHCTSILRQGFNSHSQLQLTLIIAMITSNLQLHPAVQARVSYYILPCFRKESFFFFKNGPYSPITEEQLEFPNCLSIKYSLAGGLPRTGVSVRTRLALSDQRCARFLKHKTPSYFTTKV